MSSTLLGFVAILDAVVARIPEGHTTTEFLSESFIWKEAVHRYIDCFPLIKLFA